MSFSGLMPRIHVSTIIIFIFCIIVSSSIITRLYTNYNELEYIKTITENNKLIKNDKYSHAISINTTRQLYSSLSPNLEWCSSNPFLLNFNKSIIFDLEQKWVEWSETQLTNTYDTLMNFIRSFENRKDYIVQLAYPISLPLPCHSQDGLQRYGNKTDSGKILCGIKNLNLLDKCVIYSLGSNNIFDFEQEMSNQTLCEIHTYDCTSSRPLQSINRVWFHPICIGKDAKLQESINPFTENSDHLMNKNELVFKSFRDIVQKNKHTHIHILKMDVEGSEYSIFADLFSQTNQIILPYQISFESHWWNKNIYHAMMHQKIFAQLWKSGYRFLQHEINIYDSSCIEWTLLRVFC